MSEITVTFEPCGCPAGLTSDGRCCHCGAEVTGIHHFSIVTATDLKSQGASGRDPALPVFVRYQMKCPQCLDMSDECAMCGGSGSIGSYVAEDVDRQLAALQSENDCPSFQCPYEQRMHKAEADVARLSRELAAVTADRDALRTNLEYWRHAAAAVVNALDASARPQEPR